MGEGLTASARQDTVINFYIPSTLEATAFHSQSNTHFRTARFLPRDVKSSENKEIIHFYKNFLCFLGAMTSFIRRRIDLSYESLTETRSHLNISVFVSLQDGEMQ